MTKYQLTWITNGLAVGWAPMSYADLEAIMGRTGTFVTCYLLRKGLSLKAASKKLKNTLVVPSSYSQWKFLRRYGKKVR